MEKGSSDYWNVLHTIRNNGSFKNYLLKGSLGNPKWFFCKNCFLEPIFLRVYLTCFKTTTIELLFSTSRERSVLSSFHQTFPLQTDTCACVLCRYYSGSPLFPMGLLRGFKSSSASPTWIWMSKHLRKAKFTLTPLHTRFSSTYTLFSPEGICSTVREHFVRSLSSSGNRTHLQSASSY